MSRTLTEIDAEVARLQAEREELMKPMDELCEIAWNAYRVPMGYDALDWKSRDGRDRAAFRAVVLALRPEVTP